MASGASTSGGAGVSDPAAGDGSQAGFEKVACKRKVPPIFVRDEEFYAVADELESAGVTFAAAKTGKSIRFRFSEPDEYRKAVKLLDGKSVEYHSFPMKDEKEGKYVVRGLPMSSSPEVLSLAVRRLGFEPKHVTQLRPNGKPVPLFLVYLPRQDRAILDVTQIRGLDVTIEVFRGRSGPPQCHRCQGFGHHSQHCRRQPRCVKCGKAHFSNTCGAGPEAVPRCCNCGASHPASYRGCKAAQKAANSNRQVQVEVKGKGKAKAETKKSQISKSNPKQNPEPELPVAKGLKTSQKGNKPTTASTSATEAAPDTDGFETVKRKKVGKRNKAQPSNSTVQPASTSQTAADNGRKKPRKSKKSKASSSPVQAETAVGKELLTERRKTEGERKKAQPLTSQAHTVSKSSKASGIGHKSKSVKNQRSGETRSYSDIVKSVGDRADNGGKPKTVMMDQAAQTQPESTKFVSVSTQTDELPVVPAVMKSDAETQCEPEKQVAKRSPVTTLTRKPIERTTVKAVSAAGTVKNLRSRQVTVSPESRTKGAGTAGLRAKAKASMRSPTDARDGRCARSEAKAKQSPSSADRTVVTGSKKVTLANGSDPKFEPWLKSGDKNEEFRDWARSLLKALYIDSANKTDVMSEARIIDTLHSCPIPAHLWTQTNHEY